MTQINIFNTAQKMKFSIKDFFSKCDQIRSFLQILSHLLKKSLMENLIFCEVQGIIYNNQLKLPNISASVYVSTKTAIFVFPSICRSIRTEEACNFILKKTLAQVFFCEFCEFSKNIFFTEHLQVTASLIYLKENLLYPAKLGY